MEYFSSFSKLAKAVKPAHQGSEDYIDRLNYVITPILLLAVATIVGAKQYVFQPIQCWNVQELDQGRMEYAENYCWVENTYALDKGVGHKHDEFGKPDEARTIYYYQWIPLILLSQAALFYAPHLLWLFLSNKTGVDLKQMASHACELYSDHDDEKREVKVKFLSQMLRKFLYCRARYSRRNFCRKLLSLLFGRPSFSMYLAFVYLVVKFIYITNCLLQMQLMSSFLGLKMLFGINLFMNILRNQDTWHVTNIFPRVTYCSFSVRNSMGQSQTFSLQCVLPVNMLNEKFYIMIWFWVAIVLTFNAISLLQWGMQLILSPSRRSKVKKLLKLGAQLKSYERDILHERQFVDQFLKTDGAFLLSLIKKNAGDIATSEIVLECFKAYELSLADDAKKITKNGDHNRDFNEGVSV